jgi:hypothetical protein
VADVEQLHACALAFFEEALDDASDLWLVRVLQEGWWVWRVLHEYFSKRGLDCLQQDTPMSCGNGQDL